MDEGKLFGILVLIVVSVALIARLFSNPCELQKLVICVGSKDTVTVPTCYDFDLSKYEYEFKYNGDKISYIIVTHKNNAHDVVSFPYDLVITQTKKCED